MQLITLFSITNSLTGISTTGLRIMHRYLQQNQFLIFEILLPTPLQVQLITLFGIINGLGGI
jgi:hypothetical protein